MIVEVLAWALSAAVAHVLCGIGLAYTLGRKWESVHRWYEKLFLWSGLVTGALSMIVAYYLMMVPIAFLVFDVAEAAKIIEGVQWTFSIAGVTLAVMLLIRGMYEAWVPWNQGMPEVIRSTSKVRGEAYKTLVLIIIGPFVYLGAVVLMQGQRDAEEDRLHDRN